MANFQRIFGEDGLSYLIDTSGEGANDSYFPWSMDSDDLELRSEPPPFARGIEMDFGYGQDMARSREFQPSSPESISAISDPGDLSKSAFLSPEKANYQNIDKGASYVKGAGDEIKTQFKKEFGYTPSSGELNQYATLSGKRSPLRSVLVVPQKTESSNTIGIK